MGIGEALTIFGPMVPGLLSALAQMYVALAGAPETPEHLRAHYAELGLELEMLCTLVESAPEPPEGSGRDA